MTITRMWRGWTALVDADDYERFLLGELFPSMRSISGFLGADVLRQAEGEEVSFITLTRFKRLDDIKAFAGNPSDVPVIEPRAAELLTRFDKRAQHYETKSFEA
jgi:antibiotic biosynthesis monooxygenase (ABM) superfamily enzyme